MCFFGQQLTLTFVSFWLVGKLFLITKNQKRMKKKIAVLAFGLLAFTSLVFIPANTKAQQVCFDYWVKLCEPSQGKCCYEGGSDCYFTICYAESLY